MKVIYHCYGGSHSSVVAAAVHLGLLPVDRVPTRDELLKLDYFDRMEREEHGSFRFIGEDESGNQVYVLGIEGLGDVLMRAFEGFARLYEVEENQYLFVDTLSQVNLKMRIGGWLSRSLGLVVIGRPLVISGTQDAFNRLAALGLGTRKKTARRQAERGAATGSTGRRSVP